MPDEALGKTSKPLLDSNDLDELCKEIPKPLAMELSILKSQMDAELLKMKKVFEKD